jgi:hypothetical protein
MRHQCEVPVDTLTGVTWRKARRSGKYGNCIELAALDNGAIALRHSRHPHGTALIYSRAELAAFLDSAKDGEFDDLVR